MKPEDMEILVIGDRAWGRAKTLSEALANMVKNGGSRRCYIAYIATSDSRVDPDGSLCFPHDCPPKEFHRVGIKKEIE